MNELEVWSAVNNQYLGAAMAWLRLRLKRLAQSEAVTEAEIQEVETTMRRVREGEVPPAMGILSEALELSEFEEEVLLLCAAMELDTSIAGLCGEVQDERAYPTFALAMALFDKPVWDVLLPERPLRRWRLIEIHQASAQPLTVSPLRADMRIVSYLKGVNYLDDRLSALVLPLETLLHPTLPGKGSEMELEGEGSNSRLFPRLSASQQAGVEWILRYLESVAPSPWVPVIQLLGTDTVSKQLVAQQVAEQMGLSLYRLSVELLPEQAADVETLSQLWQRESLLLPLALYLDVRGMEGKPSNDGAMAVLRRFLMSCHGLFFLDVREMSLPLERATVSWEVDKPTPTEQRQVWEAVLGKVGGESGALLASQFNLNLVEIWQVVGEVLNFPPGSVDLSLNRGVDEEGTFPPTPLLPGEGSHEAGNITLSFSTREGGLGDSRHYQLWDACLRRTRPRLDTLAQRLETKATWQHLVLPEEEMGVLRQIADQVRQRHRVYDEWGFRNRMNRGLGVSALFAGESGTGKTMAAEVIANELRLSLYRIDLSAVVSKYIGETEKNLRKLFDAAEDGGAILFFDEADALFGKRSEVKDSHDRYANIEINYLLQRIEGYRGLAILATNLKGALDGAFLRRLRFIINFPFPSVESRLVLWEKVFPQETPVDGLDYGRLARLNLTGGSIHNIAINAAFLAAREGKGVGMSEVLRAARGELRKLERPIYEEDFR